MSTDSKLALRRSAYAARRAQSDSARASREAVARFVELADYRRARTALWYVDCRTELRTREALPAALASGKRIVVPYCTVDEHGVDQLGLWRLEHLDELVVGKWRILEPPRERWCEPDRVVTPDELDIVLVPGVAFTRDGDRLGNGRGYFDRLLKRVRSDACLVGIGYECQLLDHLPSEPHDVPMHIIVTEAAVYDCRRLP